MGKTSTNRPHSMPLNKPYTLVFTATLLVRDKRISQLRELNVLAIQDSVMKEALLKKNEQFKISLKSQLLQKMMGDLKFHYSGRKVILRYHLTSVLLPKVLKTQ